MFKTKKKNQSKDNRFSFFYVIDIGINPAELRGTETGVIVAVSANEAADWWSLDPDIVNGYEFLGCTRTMYSNRISFVFDLRGIDDDEIYLFVKL